MVGGKGNKRLPEVVLAGLAEDLGGRKQQTDRRALDDRLEHTEARRREDEDEDERIPRALCSSFLHHGGRRGEVEGGRERERERESTKAGGTNERGLCTWVRTKSRQEDFSAYGRHLFAALVRT